MIKLNAEELRERTPTEEELKQIKRNPIYIIIDNVLDTYNIGAIFRLADACAVTKVYLCGKSETPPYHRIQKASVGTWQWVPWEKTESAKVAVKKLREENPQIKIIAIEQHPKSIPYTKINFAFPIAFILGHETTGVSKEALGVSDYIAEIPMFGVNKSLNVMVSLAIVLFKAVEFNKIK